MNEWILMLKFFNTEKQFIDPLCYVWSAKYVRLSSIVHPRVTYKWCGLHHNICLCQLVMYSLTMLWATCSSQSAQYIYHTLLYVHLACLVKVCNVIVQCYIKKDGYMNPIYCATLTMIIDDAILMLFECWKLQKYMRIFVFSCIYWLWYPNLYNWWNGSII